MALIAWYKLDGNANDSSGNNRNATASNLTYTTGKIFQCGSFNGIDNYISFSSLPSEYGKKSTTLSAWIKTPGIAPGMSVSGIVGINYGCTLSISSDGKLRGYSDNGASSIATYGTSNLYDDTWHHVVYTNDGFVTKLYVDSILQAQNSVVYNNRYSNPFIIGSEPNNPPVSRFNGLIDDVRIYDHALSSKEVKLLSQAKVLHYDFDDFQEPTENIVLNTNLDTGWSKDYCSNILWNDIPPPAGIASQVVSFTDSDGDNYGYWFCYGNYAPQDPSTTYTISIYARTIGAGWSVQAYTADNSEIGRQFTNTLSVPGDGLWHRLVFNSITTPADTQSDSLSFRFLSIPAGQRCWLCAPQMEAKDHATPFVNGTRTGLVKDISGYENNATLAPATTPQWSEDSKIGKGNYYFNGTINSYIQVPNTAMQNIGDFTFSTWYKASEYGNRYIFSARSTTADNYFQVGVQASSFRLFIASSNYNPPSINYTNVWEHVVITRQGTSLKTYKNGVLIDTSTCVSTSISINGAIIIAQEQDSVGGGFAASQAWLGYIDDFRLYNTALSSTDILELYQTRANLDNVGNLSVRGALSSTWPKNAYEYKQLNPSAVSGVYNIRPTGSSNYIEAYCDMSTLTHSGETGWTLVGSWAEASEWGKTSLSSAEPFLTTVKNCISSNFGNEVIHAFRILVSNDITQTGSAAVADWYYYWAEGTTWKAVWAPDGRNFEYWFSPASSGVPRTILRPFDLSYNLKFGYARTTHKYNNLSDYGYTNTTMRSDIKGLIGGSNAGVNGYCNYWRALTQPGYKFGAYNLSYSGSFESGTSPCADGTLAIPTSASASVCMGQDVDSGVSAKIGYDDGGAWKAASTAASTAVTISDVAANGVKMWWFIL